MSNADLGIVFTPPYDNVLIENTSDTTQILTVGETLDYTVTASNRGLIQGFLATVNIRAPATAANGEFLITLYRNDKVLAKSTISGVDWTPRVVFYETLGFLAGSRVYKGETFRLNISTNNFLVGTQVPIDVAVTLTITQVD